MAKEHEENAKSFKAEEDQEDEVPPAVGADSSAAARHRI